MSRWLAERPLATARVPGESWDLHRWNIRRGLTDSADVQNEFLRLRPNNGTSFPTATALLTPAIADMMLVRFSRNATTTHRGRIILSSSGIQQGTTEFPTKGYSLQFSNTGTVIIQKNEAGTNTTLATSATGIVSGTGIFWFRFERTATNLRAKVWTDGVAEPTAWTLDVAEATLPAGVPELVMQGAAVEFRVHQLDVYRSGVATRDTPTVFRDLSGRMQPYGQTQRVLFEDRADSATPPTGLTGTTTYDSANMARVITGAGTATPVDIALPAITVAGFSAIEVIVEGLRSSSESYTEVTLGLLGGGERFALRHLSAETHSRLDTGATASKVLLNSFTGRLAAHRRTVRAILHRSGPQLHGMVFGDQLIGHVDLTGVAFPTTLTPTLRFAAGNTVTLAYDRLAVIGHR